MIKYIKENVVTTYGLIGLLFYFVIWAGNIQYDQGGIKGIIFLLSQVFQVPFWIVGEFLFILNSGEAISGQLLVSIIGGLLLCFLIDLTIKRFLMRRDK